MSDEFSETDEWPTPQGWMRHQAETGLAPPQNGTLRPNDDRTVWRDRGVRIAALETENAELRAQMATVAATTLREEADAMFADGEYKPKFLSGGYGKGLLHASRVTSWWLRHRADRIERGE